MSDQGDFAERIRQRYPEGLTGVIAVGGTRTTYILQHNREASDPGHISDFLGYAGFMLQGYYDLAETFFSLGGQHLVMPVLAYQRFYEKGSTYAEQIARLGLWLTDDTALAYYQRMQLNPYFIGIDTLQHLPPNEPGHQLGNALAQFQQEWQYEPGRRSLIWEVAPIPLYSIWRAMQQMSADERQALDEQLAIQSAEELEQVDKTLYQHFARAVYGVDLPMPHFYLGSNRDGDLKLRSMMPFALYSGSPLRLFYTPYPSLFTTRETLKNLMEDLAFGKPEFSTNADYKGRYSPERVKSNYEHVMMLSNDPSTTLGITGQSMFEGEPDTD